MANISGNERAHVVHKPSGQRDEPDPLGNQPLTLAAVGEPQKRTIRMAAIAQFPLQSSLKPIS